VERSPHAWADLPETHLSEQQQPPETHVDAGQQVEPAVAAWPVGPRPLTHRGIPALQRVALLTRRPVFRVWRGEPRSDIANGSSSRLAGKEYDRGNVRAMKFREAALLATAVSIPLLLLVLSNKSTHWAPLPVWVALSSIPSAICLTAWSSTRRIPAIRAVVVFYVSFLCLMTMFIAGGQLLKLDLPVLVPVSYVLVCVGAYWVLLTYLSRRLE